MHVTQVRPIDLGWMQIQLLREPADKRTTGWQVFSFVMIFFWKNSRMTLQNHGLQWCNDTSICALNYTNNLDVCVWFTAGHRSNKLSAYTKWMNTYGLIICRTGSSIWSLERERETWVANIVNCFFQLQKNWKAAMIWAENGLATAILLGLRKFYSKEETKTKMAMELLICIQFSALNEHV